jgi:hypothetical protein
MATLDEDNRRFLIQRDDLTDKIAEANKILAEQTLETEYTDWLEIDESKLKRLREEKPSRKPTQLQTIWFPLLSRLSRVNLLFLIFRRRCARLS